MKEKSRIVVKATIGAPNSVLNKSRTPNGKKRASKELIKEILNLMDSNIGELEILGKK